MKVPLSWIKKYVPVSMPAEELAHRLTMAGVEVGAVEDIGGHWDRDKVFVGHVLRVDEHPNAERLTLPTIDVGRGDTVTVVCGAPNVAAGQKIAFAAEGAQLVSPRTGKLEKLKPARIRGVMSSGMVCSALELGLGEDHEGIIVLDGEAPIGMPLVDYLGDAILDTEVTPNRPDCLSILGIAHEVAAIVGERVAEPDLSYAEEGQAIETQISIEIADPDLCYRYTASLVTGVAIGPSPQWLQDDLIKAGQRPINNVVDITNYVMLEYGQPLHAFDMDAVKERTIIVRAARPGEVLVTLDDEKLTLQPPILTIADARDAVGLAGVMGGANSEIHESTTSVLLESANFDAINTKRTRSALGINTGASYRFERGIRAELAPLALRRATQLLIQICGGQAARGIVDLYPGRTEPPTVQISSARIEQVLGAKFDMAKVAEVLYSLGFETTAGPQAASDPAKAATAPTTQEHDSILWMKTPYWRSDISIEDDLVEEVARSIGYDNIPTTMLSASIPHHEPQPMRAFREHLRDTLAATGMQETISYPLTSLESLGEVEALIPEMSPLKIANPVSSELGYLRTSLRGSVLQTLSHNRRTSPGDGIRLFEIGRVYLPGEGGGGADLPDEKEMLVGVLSGPRYRLSWLDHEADMDFFDAKGVLESAFSTVGVTAAYEPSTDPVMRPGRTAQISSSGNPVGIIGEVHPRTLERFDLEGSPVALFEVDLRLLHQVAPSAPQRYHSTSRYPESHRDLALIVDADIASAAIRSIIEQHKLVVSTAPFDIYSGEGIAQGKKSVAYRISFQSSSATLTTEQVNRAQQDILRRLQQELGSELRD